MKRTHAVFTALLFAGSLVAVAAAQQSAALGPATPRLSMVVSTTWLAEHVADRNLVLLHVGTKEDYAAGHIPGARFITLADLSAPAGQGLSLELPTVERLAPVLEGLGIGNGSRIVIYFSKDQWAQAGRVFFTLDSFGLGDSTSILNGGLAAWQAEGRAVTTDVKEPARASLTLRPRQTVVDYAWVAGNSRRPGVALVDARPADQYTGTKPAGRPPRSGHIPGALNIPVASLIVDGTRLKDPTELQEVFRSAGVGSPERVVTYCNIGQQASGVYFAARYLGYDVTLYDGSMEDWNAHGGDVVAEASAVPSGPRWVNQAGGTTARLRGVSAVSLSVAWASGSDGTFARTIDGGATWTAGVVPGAEDMDFRDVEAFSADTAYLLSIGAGDRSRIYKTTDGGRTWALQFKNLNPDAFFDAMAFWDEKSGIVMGDPIDGRLVIVRTFDGGLTWIDVPSKNVPATLPGEAAFAASGTCIVTQGRDQVWIGTGGGPEARVFRSSDRGFTWSVAATPIAAGTASAGIFSVAFSDAKNGVAVGGDYRKEGEPSANLAITVDGGATWAAPGTTRLRGFRSAVAYVPGGAAGVLIAVGPDGSDFSIDGGRTWTALDGPGFHALSLAGGADAGWAVGEGGRIAKLAGPLPAGR